ncbi:MAG: hypothetical protein MJK14_20015 [Rivularia sp. ALOHA_DT_140]|nr:hypothetical protein [Rivularia sp. ALOHA_DT_140]
MILFHSFGAILWQYVKPVEQAQHGFQLLALTFQANSNIQLPLFQYKLETQIWNADSLGSLIALTPELNS